MYKQNFMASVTWALMPVATAIQSLGHGFLWLALCGIRKLFQLKFDTGFASIVLLERAQLASSLMCASFVLFRMRVALAAFGLGRKTFHNVQSDVTAQPQEQ